MATAKKSAAEKLLVDGVLTVKETIAESKLSRGTLYSLMDRGELKYVKVGHRRLIPRRALLDLLVTGLARAAGGAA